MNYETFKHNCETFARYFDVDVEVKYIDLSAHGLADWWSAWFMTDRFGGLSCEVAFRNGQIRFTDRHGEKIFPYLIDALLLAPEAIEETRKDRENVVFQFED